MKLIVLMGLPASGKTTFAKQYLKANNKGNYPRYKQPTVRYLDIDSVVIDKDAYLKRYSKGYDEVIVDGLFLTNESIKHILDTITNPVSTLEIHYWKPDRDACMWNDAYRRSENALITIKNAILEDVNVSLFKTDYGITNVNVIMHEVQRKSNLQIFIDKYQIFVNDKCEITSESWCLGGSYGDCWGNTGTVSAEAPPIGFERFDDLLQEICPQLTFLQYKSIYNKCVSTDMSTEHDYYGGSTSHAHFVCNVAMLYSELLQLGFIND